MQSTQGIPNGATELRALSPTEWFAFKNRIIREARVGRAAVLRTAFRQILTGALRCVHAGRTTVESLFAATRSRPQSGHF